MSQDVSCIAQYFSFDSAAYRHNVLTRLRAAQKSIQLTFNRNSNKLFLLYVYVLINIIRDAAAWTVFSNSSNLDTEKKWKSERAERRKKRRLFISRQSDYHPPKRRRIRERGAGEFRGMTRCSIEILSFFASSIFVSSADTSLKLIKKNLRNRCPNLYIKTSSNNCTKFFASVRFFREKRNLTLRKMKQKS